MKKALNMLNSLDEWIAMGFFVIMCIAVGTQMVLRIVFNNASLYTEEIARFSYIWIVFLCMSIGEKYGEHFAVEVFLRGLKGTPDRLLRAVLSLSYVVLFGYLFYCSVEFFFFQQVIKSAALEISMALIALAMVVGFGLEIVRCLLIACENIRAVVTHQEETEEM